MEEQPVKIEVEKPITIVSERRSRFSDPVIVAMIGGIVSIVSLFMTLKINTKVDTVHKQINSRMDELLKVSKELSRAKGNDEGRAFQVSVDSLADYLDDSIKKAESRKGRGY